jgi:hypothetical protein
VRLGAGGLEGKSRCRQAFDEAWLAIAGHTGNDPHDIERARLRLASALLSVASEESRNVEVLKPAALKAVALAYRERPAVEPEYHRTAHSFFESQTGKR